MTYINYRDTLSYMGYKKLEIDPTTQELLKKAETVLTPAINPKFVKKTYKISHDLEVIGTELSLKSKDLAELLKNYNGVVLLAATLGAEVDKLIRQLGVIDTPLAFAVDAMADTAIEGLCDEIEENVRQTYGEITMRFSPGYGDLPLNIQNNFLKTLNAGKQIGLFANENHILTPRKSVTAIIGVKI
jgi:uncharacterized coiled-coil DUF342 family protein